MVNKKIYFVILFISYTFFPNYSLAQQEKLIRITGGPIFFDALNNNEIDFEKWQLWGVDYEEKKHFSYKTGASGFTILSEKNCFKALNHYGLISKPVIRGLTNFSLISEVEPHNKSSLPAVVHLCNCCSKFSGLNNDDFWNEVIIKKDMTFQFNSVEILNSKDLNTRHIDIPNNFEVSNKTKPEKYLIKITQESPSYEIKGYIRPLIPKAVSKYVQVSSTQHPYPQSQVKVEIKTYTYICKEENELQKPNEVATFRNVRVYKNPENNPLFVRVINKEGTQIKGVLVKLMIKDLFDKEKVISAETDINGYATLQLTELNLPEYPLNKFEIKVIEPNSDKLLFSYDFNNDILENGVYPGDFWQVFCERCD